MLEEAFDDKIPENEANEFETVGDVVNFIKKKGLMKKNLLIFVCVMKENLN